jgi:antirestriction protein ArdC
MSRVDFYEEAAASIRRLMDEHGTGWVKPWANASAYSNGVSGHRYAGLNTLLLMMASQQNGWADPRFVGFKQAGTLSTLDTGWLKGQHGVRILAPMIGKRDDGAGGERTVMFGAKPMTLFNVSQVQGLDLTHALPLPDARAADPVAVRDEADRVIRATGARITHAGDQAFYSPAQDSITMPPKPAWTGSKTTTGTDAYYSTLFHELGHWTGHKSRLDRLKGGGRHGHDYAFEELVAEITAVFACRHTGATMEPTPDNAKYLNGWRSKLVDRAGVDFFASAASRAQKACDWIIDGDPALAVDAAA